MADIAMDDRATEYWVLRPCVSLPANGGSSERVLAAAILVSGAIGTGFGLAGAWPVLPFAGLEIAALWLAIRHLERHAGDYEKLSRSGKRLLLERAVGGHVQRLELNSHWARLRVDGAPDGRECRLFIGSHGREVEIGRQLTGKQKKALAAELKKIGV